MTTSDATGVQTDGQEHAKADLRARLKATRRARNADDLATATAAIEARVLALDELRDARTVTVYVGRGTEPGTSGLLDALAARGVRVLLPVLMDDMDLDWAEYTGADVLAPSSLPRNSSLLEPTGRRLGPAAVAMADVVLAPGLAVGPDGVRLGFGGGCYDRALGRVDPATPVVVLLFDDELLDAVPAEPHDRPVLMAVTPTRTVRFDGHAG